MNQAIAGRSKENYDALSKVSNSSIVPHAPYSVSDALWQLLQPYYQNKVVSIHNQETVFEDELFFAELWGFCAYVRNDETGHFVL